MGRSRNVAARVWCAALVGATSLVAVDAEPAEAVEIVASAEVQCGADAPAIVVTAHYRSGKSTLTVSAPAVDGLAAFSTSRIVFGDEQAVVSVPAVENGTRTITVSGEGPDPIADQTLTVTANCLANPRFVDLPATTTCVDGVSTWRAAFLNDNGGAGESMTVRLEAPEDPPLPAVDQVLAIGSGRTVVAEIPLVTGRTPRPITFSSPSLREPQLVRLGVPPPCGVIVVDRCGPRSLVLYRFTTYTDPDPFDGLSQPGFPAVEDRPYSVDVTENDGTPLKGSPIEGVRDCQRPVVDGAPACATAAGVTGLSVSFRNDGPEATTVTLGGITRNLPGNGVTTIFAPVAEGGTVDLAPTSTGGPIEPIGQVTRACEPVPTSTTTTTTTTSAVPTTTTTTTPAAPATTTPPTEPRVAADVLPRTGGGLGPLTIVGAALVLVGVGLLRPRPRRR